MPALVKNCALQCIEGIEEQGSFEDVWQVLSLGVGHEDDVAMLYIHFSVPILCYACIKMTVQPCKGTVCGWFQTGRRQMVKVRHSGARQGLGSWQEARHMHVHIIFIHRHASLKSVPK